MTQFQRILSTSLNFYWLLTKIRRTRWHQRSRNTTMLPRRVLLKWWRSVWSFCGNICSNRQTVKIRAKKLLTLQKPRVKHLTKRTVENPLQHTNSSSYTLKIHVLHISKNCFFKSCYSRSKGRDSGWIASFATNSSAIFIIFGYQNKFF